MILGEEVKEYKYTKLTKLLYKSNIVGTKHHDKYLQFVQKKKKKIVTMTIEKKKKKYNCLTVLK